MLVSRGGNERAQASAVDRRAVEFFGCGFLVRRLFRSVRWPPSVGCSLPVSQFGPGLWRSLVPRAGEPAKIGAKGERVSVGRRLPAPRCRGKSPEEGGRKADRDRQREEKGAGRRAGRPAVGRRRAGGVPGGSRRHEGRRGTRSSLVAAAAPRSPFRTALTRTREPRPDPPWRSSGASERLPGGPAQSRSPCRSGRRGAGRCSGKGEHLSADVAHAHPHARARAVFPPRPGGRARAFPHRPSSSTSPHPYPSRPLPASPIPSVDR